MIHISYGFLICLKENAWLLFIHLNLEETYHQETIVTHLSHIPTVVTSQGQAIVNTGPVTIKKANTQAKISAKGL